MRQNAAFIPTLRDTPAGTESISHQLLLRGGFIRQTAAGMYSYLPLGSRVLENIKHIIKEEMDATGAQELLMPAIQPAEIWHETGRWHVYGPELMRLKDRHDRDFALGATGEEMITNLAREVKSYKELPMTLYQVQTKYRDEKRPRFGLLRGREFLMKDAYSFDTSQEGLDVNYDVLYQAYQNIFARCGLNFRVVTADSGAMGGKDTQEFMALADIGEDTIAYSDTSDYAANIEMAEVHTSYISSNQAQRPLEQVDSSAQSVSDLSSAIKGQLFTVDDERVYVLVRADHDINDTKLKNLLSASICEEVADSDTYEQTSMSLEALNPVDLSDDVTIIADEAVAYVVNGAFMNDNGHVLYHHLNVSRDITVSQFADIRMIQEGEPSPDGFGHIQFAQGIEIGQIFKLGTWYSETMNAEFLDENGRSKPLVMGCYGIGVSRTIPAVVEQYHDDRGMIWPAAIAPYHIHLLTVNHKNDEQRELADQLYDKLQYDFDVLYDDRRERAGVKFADSDLIGLPVRVTVGKKANENIVEVKTRQDGDMQEVAVEDLGPSLQQLLQRL